MTVKMKKGNQFADINESSVRQAQFEGWSLVESGDQPDVVKAETEEVEKVEDVVSDDGISHKRTSRKTNK